MFGWVPVTLKSAKGSHTSLPKLEASAVANKFKKEDNLDKKFVQLTLFVSQTSQENTFTILPDFKSSIQGLYKTLIQKSGCSFSRLLFLHETGRSHTSRDTGETA